VAHNQDLRQGPAGQAPAPRRPRLRRCLLKGCEGNFVPDDPLSRYCGKECRTEARRWSQGEANRRYRSSEGGRRCRREQACRYRQRLRERRASGEIATEAAREGYQNPLAEKKSCCQRPGCYEQFVPSGRSPLQKFCSWLCRQALRRVLIREQRWRDYFAARAGASGEQPVAAPSRPALGDAYFWPRRR
jgi:hypothetical protein